jgi:hypothetical protein
VKIAGKGNANFTDIGADNPLPLSYFMRHFDDNYG